MPTINQLVRKPRKSKVEKSKSPALNVGYNSVKSSNKRFITTKARCCNSCRNNDT